jgi:hypothetical protein
LQLLKLCLLNSRQQQQQHCLQHSSATSRHINNAASSMSFASYLSATWRVSSMLLLPSLLIPFFTQHATLSLTLCYTSLLHL